MLELILFLGFASVVARCQADVSQTCQNLDKTADFADAVYAELMKG